MTDITSPSRLKRWQSICLLFVFAVAIIAVLIAFLFCYGSAQKLICWAALMTATAYSLRYLARRFSVVIIVVAFIGLLIWPIDATLKFPVLRKLYEIAPFGSYWKVYPSPSGHCVAYLYDHGFQDRAYEVRFAHGLWFPEVRNSVPYDDKGHIDSWWDKGTFIIEVSGIGRVLLYDEETHEVTFPKGP